MNESHEVRRVPMRVAGAFCLMALSVGLTAGASEAGLSLDVAHGLCASGVFDRNAAGDAQTDDTKPIQAAIDHVAQSGGGSVIVPAGTYRIEGIRVVDGVRLVGAGPEKTILRVFEAKPYALITVAGGALEDLAVYGTPTEAESGDNWRVGTDGKGVGSTARPVHLIHVSGAYHGAALRNVHALESRYDCLYVRGSKGLRVDNCRFDRAGRNVVSMVGNDEDFAFSNCTIGSLWGLYHFDIEPAGGRYVRDGVFDHCIFDGREAGKMDTGTWGSFLCFCGHGELQSRAVTVRDCTFHRIYVRVHGVFPEVQFLNNTFDTKGRAFVRVDTNPVGEFRDAVVRGNRFLTRGQPARAINQGVSFTGTSTFARNRPRKFNGPGCTAESKSEPE